MLTIEFRGLDQAIRDLEKFATRAVPYAMRNSVNSSAFEAQRAWRAEINRSFVTRNRYTERSIQVDKARGLNVRRAEAFVGSTASYMNLQEFGGTERGGGRHKAIPGPSAAGQAPGSKRTKMVRSGSRLGAIKVSRGAPATATPKRRNLIAVLQAMRAGKKHVLLTRKSGGKGIYLITGGRRKFKTRLLYDVSRGSVRVPPQPTLQRTLRAIRPKVIAIHEQALLAELKRNHVAGY